MKRDAGETVGLRTNKAEKSVEKYKDDMSKSDKGKLDKPKQSGVCRPSSFLTAYGC